MITMLTDPLHKCRLLVCNSSYNNVMKESALSEIRGSGAALKAGNDDSRAQVGESVHLASEPKRNHKHISDMIRVEQLGSVYGAFRSENAKIDRCAPILSWRKTKTEHYNQFFSSLASCQS